MTKKEPTMEEIEEAARINMENFGAPDILYLEDPDTGEFVKVNVKNPSEEDIKFLKRLVEVGLF